jgi:nitrous oxidase accessory protein NosD
MKPPLAILWSLLAATIAAGRDDAGLIERDTLLSADLVVAENTTLIVKPGVVLRLEGYHAIIVRGVLICEGTREEPILITCAKRPRGATGKPCWQGLTIVGDKANALFRHCRIEGAYRTMISAASPVFDSCRIAGNHYGIYCTDRSKVHITNCRIYRNRYGIAADYASPMILDNVITENTVGVHLQLSSTLLAGRNLIEGNRHDIRSDDTFGENNDITTVKRLWDLMRQLY